MKGNTNAIIINEGAPTGDYKVKVIDYDGTIIDEKYCNLNDEYTLPTPPTHTGLTFQEWSSPYQINNGKIIVTNDVIAGPIYTTESGKNEFDIILNQNTGKTFTLNLNGTKDWGDGSSDSATTHTYADYGNYTITCDGNLMNTMQNSGLFGQSQTDAIPNQTVVEVRLATIITINMYAFAQCSSLKRISLSNSLRNTVGYSFLYNHVLETIILPSSISQGNSGDHIFMYNRSLKNVVLPHGMNNIPEAYFRYCYALKEIILPLTVTNVNTYGFDNCYALEKAIFLGGTYVIGDYAFNNCSNLQNFDSTRIDGRVGSYAFAYNYGYNDDIILNNVISLGDYAFAYNMSVKKFKVNSNISSIGSYALASNYNILEYDFKANNQVPTLSAVDAFNHINQLAKIKVPWDLYQNWIVASNWSTYASYIDGGTPATINFTGDNTGDIYVNGNLISGTSTTWVGTNMPYYVYDSTDNIVLPTQTVTGITEASTQNVNIDLSSKNKITLSVGISGLTTTFTIEGKTYNAIEDNGDYFIYVVGTGVQVNYNINSGDSYTDAHGSISTANQDITIPITISPASWETFVRPNLTANGTMGGESFAVASYTGGSNPSYYAVNGSSSNYWSGQVYTSSGTQYAPRYFIYNPNPLKITQLVLTFTSSSTQYTTPGIEISGSNDGENYEILDSNYTLSGANGTLNVNNDTGYQYYRLKLNLRNTTQQIRVSNIGFTATEKVASNTSNIGEPIK
ncbi:MAG: leucine-rich repeat protein [Bacilli bacterium]|nr:leucine-rich repeat protein [Bacilli bacterium]